MQKHNEIIKKRKNSTNDVNNLCEKEREEEFLSINDFSMKIPPLHSCDDAKKMLLNNEIMVSDKIFFYSIFFQFDAIKWKKIIEKCFVGIMKEFIANNIDQKERKFMKSV